MSGEQRSRTSPPVFALEPMRGENLDAVLAIEQAVFSNPWRRQDFQYALKKEGNCCLVATAGGRVVGYAIGFYVVSEFHLADFAVHPDLQSQGMGRHFLERVIDLVRRNDIYVVTLEVRVSNAPAIGLYRKFGFETVAIRRGYYSRPAEDALVMLKALRGQLSDWVSGTYPRFAGEF